MKIVAIANPVAGRRQAPRHWPRLLTGLGKAAAQVPTWWSAGPGQAELLAAQARRQGFERVIVVGGDGTLFEVINGLWWEPQGRLPSLGMVPFGTGCDYVRNFDLGRNLQENLATALGKAETPIDAGICRLQGLDGQPRQRIFVNVLGLGFDARVIQRLQQQRRYLRGQTAYLIAGLEELFHLRSHRFQGKIDERLIEAEINLLAVGLGRYFGGGLRITPQASPQAGRFQVVWVERLSRLGALGLLPGLWTGRHLNHPKVHQAHAVHLQALTEPPAYIQAEGELVGRPPLVVEMRRSAFFFAGAPARSIEVGDRGYLADFSSPGS
jgi:diacylglycerol kinase (ATP)